MPTRSPKPGEDLFTKNHDVALLLYCVLNKREKHQDHKEAWNTFEECANNWDETRQIKQEAVEDWLKERAFNTKRGVQAAGDFGPGSNYSALWKCTYKHYWIDSINAQGKKGGCPTCTGKTNKPTAENNLLAKHPEVAKQLKCVLHGGKASINRHKNDLEQILGGQDTVPDSEVEEWLEEEILFAEPPITAVEYNKLGAKKSAYKIQEDGTYVLEKTERHTRQKNGKRGEAAAEEQFPNSGHPALWRCAANHYWVACPDNQIGLHKKGKLLCQRCAGNCATAENNLYKDHPDLAAELYRLLRGPHSTAPTVHKEEWLAFFYAKNHTVDDAAVDRWLLEEIDIEGIPGPRQYNGEKGEAAAKSVVSDSEKPALWKCATGHYYVAKVSNRKRNRSGCPFCTGQYATAEHNLLVKHPEVAKQLVCVLHGGKASTTRHNKDLKQLLGDRDTISEGEIKKWLQEEILFAEPITAVEYNELAGDKKRREYKIQEDGTYVLKKAERHTRQKNGKRRKDAAKELTPHSNMPALWKCEKGHYTVAGVDTRTAGYMCRHCSQGGWTVQTLRELLATFESSLSDLSPASVYTIMEYAGAFETKSSLAKKRIKVALTTIFKKMKKNRRANAEGEVDDFAAVADEVLATLHGGADDGASCIVEDDTAGDDSGDDDSSRASPLDSHAPCTAFDAKAQADRTIKAGIECLRATRFERKMHNRETGGGRKDDVEAIEFLIGNQLSKLWKLAIREEEDKQIEHLDVDEVQRIQKVVTSLQKKLDTEDVVLKSMLEVSENIARSSCDVTGSVQHMIDRLVSDVPSVPPGDSVASTDDRDAFHGNVLRACFVAQYLRVKQWKLPEDYNPKSGDRDIAPSLMQRLTVIRLRDSPHNGLGNWSDTGTGKTLSAVLASRDYGAHLTLVLCPKDCISNWERTIGDHFPACEVKSTLNNPLKTITFNCTWGKDASAECARYLIINYNQLKEECDVSGLLDMALPREIKSPKLFLVVDEIQKVKRRGQLETKHPQHDKVIEGENEEAHGYGDDENSHGENSANNPTKKKISLRSEQTSNLILAMRSKDEKSRVLGLSATPVINDLTEAKSLIRMITMKARDDLECTPWHSVPVCMRIHRALMGCGLRISKDDPPAPTIVDVDCTEGLVKLDRDTVQDPMKNILEVEKVLTLARIGKIVERIKEHKERNVGPVLLYTYFIGGSIRQILKDAFEKKGIHCRWFTGSETTEQREDIKNKFRKGQVNDIDVLVGTAAIVTGIDGLQYSCSCLMFNSLPYTYADYHQIIGRLDREGQRNNLQIFIFRATAREGEHSWSWDDRNWARIERKRDIADVAVDGNLPEDDSKLLKLSNHRIMQALKDWRKKMDQLGTRHCPGRNDGLEIIANTKVEQNETRNERNKRKRNDEARKQSEEEKAKKRRALTFQKQRHVEAVEKAAKLDEYFQYCRARSKLKDVIDNFIKWQGTYLKKNSCIDATVDDCFASWESELNEDSPFRAILQEIRNNQVRWLRWQYWNQALGMKNTYSLRQGDPLKWSREHRTELMLKTCRELCDQQPWTTALERLCSLLRKCPDFIDFHAIAKNDGNKEQVEEAEQRFEKSVRVITAHESTGLSEWEEPAVL